MDDWKLVPVVPTEQMTAAAAAECHRLRGVIDPVAHVWDAMLAAAPSAHADVEALRRDALRYRWLRGQCATQTNLVQYTTRDGCRYIIGCHSPQDMDFAVEAGMRVQATAAVGAA